MGSCLIPVMQIIADARLIFWDFDGVIKDSVDVKTRAFEALFRPYGGKVAARVREHHQANGGISRFEKMPLYLGWVGLDATEKNVVDFCRRFSSAVLDAVIDSPWVPGVLDYLERFHHEQHFVLVTATPQSEIEIILDRIGIAHYFQKVFGAPMSKAKVISDVLNELNIPLSRALMIGDAESDLLAAEQNGVPFLLRRTAINHPLQQRYPGPQLGHFNQ